MEQSESTDPPVGRVMEAIQDAAELFRSSLGNREILSSGTLVLWYISREREFTLALSGLMRQCQHSQWWLFVDYSEISLKAVLLHNGNSSASLSVGQCASEGKIPKRLTKRYVSLMPSGGLRRVGVDASERGVCLKCLACPSVISYALQCNIANTPCQESDVANMIV
ncbi:hypothetical protein J437_LFUL002739 [Ladona fulva]|uniref:Uncharacterized protein n=1 Tax=Ladona fulva TaxID=123851 RepID=A0A8K0K0Z3_LADFU|nr:hypothetical protein J437_LFUL002739 [Ladona fulva]